MPLQCCAILRLATSTGPACRTTGPAFVPPGTKSAPQWVKRLSLWVTANRRTHPHRMLCGHLFCTSCIREWLREANSCPATRLHWPRCLICFLLFSATRSAGTSWRRGLGMSFCFRNSFGTLQDFQDKAACLLPSKHWGFAWMDVLLPGTARTSSPDVTRLHRDAAEVACVYMRKHNIRADAHTHLQFSSPYAYIYMRAYDICLRMHLLSLNILHNSIL